MAQAFPYQRGEFLHAAIVGAFKAAGMSFEVWCRENGINPGGGRNITYGISKGPKGRALLEQMIEAAGPELVRIAYETRVKAHAAELKKGGA